MIFALIIFILILSVLVLIHEFGHFIAARKTGVRVEEFGFGLPPRVIGKKIGETLYSLNLLPFGGFVRLLGEDDADSKDFNLESAKHNPRNFIAKKPWERVLIVGAGVLMNLFLAIFLYYIFFFVTGFKSFNLPLFYEHNFRFGHTQRYDTVVLGIDEGSSADLAEITIGDAILEISGAPVYNLSDVRRILADKSGEEVSITLMDLKTFDEEIRTLSTTIKEGEEGRGVLGVFVGSSVTLDYSGNRKFSGLAHTYNMVSYATRTFGNLIKEAFTAKDIAPVSSTVAGPVGIFSLVDGILAESADPILSIVDLVALLSITLAIVNILPLPALDGGRILFIAFEKIKGSPISPRFEQAIHKAGMLFLLVILALVTIRDITRII